MIKLVNGAAVQMTQEEQDAWLASLAQPQANVTRVTALAALKAIDAAGLASAYDAWANSPDRTFLERAHIEKALHWEITDPVVQAGATALGLNQEQLQAMFNSAS